MARSSKDIAKRLRFDHRPRADPFRRWYWLAGAARLRARRRAAWFGFARDARRAPVPARSGDRGARHLRRPLRALSRRLRLGAEREVPRLPRAAPCTREFEVDTPACRDCHIEHRRDDLLVDAERTGVRRLPRRPATAAAQPLVARAHQRLRRPSRARAAARRRQRPDGAALQSPAAPDLRQRSTRSSTCAELPPRRRPTAATCSRSVSSRTASAATSSR